MFYKEKSKKLNFWSQILVENSYCKINLFITVPFIYV